MARDDELLKELESNARFNFWMMDVCVTMMIACSAYFAELFIRRGGTNELYKTIIKVPDGLYHASRSSGDLADIDLAKSSSSRNPYLYYFLWTSLYFVAMTFSVVSMSRHPVIMVVIQHIAVLFVVLIYFCQFTRSSVSIPLAIIFAVFWLCSADTAYRWIFNNFIVLMCTLLTGYIQFRNFAYLQIFMWLAFVYDVYMLAGIQIGRGSALTSLFSFDSTAATTSLSAAGGHTIGEGCSSLLCTMFHHNNNYELPTVFSIQVGHRSCFVYIGTGDIIIGAFVANFAFSFFKKTKHLVITLLGFAFGVGLLSQVTQTPFPALLSIVPLCTVALLISAVSSSRTFELLLDSCSEKSSCVKAKASEMLLV